MAITVAIVDISHGSNRDGRSSTAGLPLLDYLVWKHEDDRSAGVGQQPGGNRRARTYADDPRRERCVGERYTGRWDDS